MALGTLVAGAASYSAAAGTTVSPAYPAGILATDAVILVVGQKPSTANGGTVTTPTGWTLREELTGAGGYGTTIGADVGNTNLRIYTWNTPVAGQTGNLTVTLSANDVSWAYIARIPTGGGSLSYGTADGQRTTTPTSPMSVALTNGASATNFQTGDLAVWAMCIPTDVTTPAQFSAQSITATGATFATAAEINEPDSGTGNDIGGFSARALVTAGSSTTAPTITVTLAGTLTNVRGPVALLRIRETLAERTGSLSVTETGTDAFSATGEVLVSGALAVSETGADTFSATGTVMEMTATGSLVATETGNDIFTSSGDVIVRGSLVATEVGNDTFAATGDVIVKGSLAATETGLDTFSASGEVADIISAGIFAATETGNDVFTSSAKVIVSGSLSVTEANDSFAGSGAIIVKGGIAALETGTDSFTGTGVTTPVRSGALAATEAADTLGSYAVDGYVVDGYTLNGWQGFVYYEMPLPSTVLAGTRYGPHGIYVGTLDAGGTGTRIEITSGKIVKLVGDTGALIIN